MQESAEQNPTFNPTEARYMDYFSEMVNTPLAIEHPLERFAIRSLMAQHISSSLAYLQNCVKLMDEPARETHEDYLESEREVLNEKSTPRSITKQELLQKNACKGIEVLFILTMVSPPRTDSELAKELNVTIEDLNNMKDIGIWSLQQMLIQGSPLLGIKTPSEVDTFPRYDKTKKLSAYILKYSDQSNFEDLPIRGIACTFLWTFIKENYNAKITPSTPIDVIPFPDVLKEYAISQGFVKLSDLLMNSEDEAYMPYTLLPYLALLIKNNIDSFNV